MSTQPKLLFYDICDPKRLRKVHRITSQTMMAVQKSVFYAELTEVQADNLLDELRQVIDITCDKVSMFRVRGVDTQINLGPTLQSEGVFIFHDSGLMH